MGKKRLSLFSFAFLFLFFSSLNLSAQISGTVWEDLAVRNVSGTINLNTYGEQETNERGVANVTVTVYSTTGSTSSTTTDASGDWDIAGISGAVRVEFSNWPSYMQSSVDAAMQNTSVQFVTAPASNVDFGLHVPDNFSDSANPPIVLPRWYNGEASSASPKPAIHSFNYNSSGQNMSDFAGASGPVPNNDVDFDEVGTVWGIANQKNYDRYFAATAVRAHSGMANSTGHIYVIETSGTTSLDDEFNLNGINTANGGVIDLGEVCRGGGCENNPGNTGDASDYELGSESSPSYDIDAAYKVGTVAFGDIDMQPGTNILWAVNLNQKALITIDVSNTSASSLPGAVDQRIITALPGVPSCTNGELRPWALNFANGKGYLGVVCDASTSNDGDDLEGYILSFDPNNLAAGFTTELNIPTLDFRRDENEFNFRPWTNSMSDFDVSSDAGNRYVASQPIIADIEFDEDGDMIIGVIDRGGMQLGNQNYTLDLNDSSTRSCQSQGDIWHACKTGAGFVMENNSASCPYNFTPNNEGFDGDGEFFDDESGDETPEGAEGALAILKGSNQVIAAMLDPHPSGMTGNIYFDSKGISFFNTETGEIDDYYTSHDTNNRRWFGKSGGIGDVELLTAPAPIEIGNLVWLDTDGDGVQDPGEAGIAGVTVELLDAGGASIAIATTDTNGNYIFSNNPVGTISPSHRYNLTDLNPNETYTVRIPNVSGGSKQAVLNASSLNLTSANTGQGTNADINDSDGTETSNNANAPVAAADIPFFGANNHTFDFGFTAAPPSCNLTDAGKANEACNNNGTTADGADDYITFDLNPTGSNTAGTYNVSVDNGATISPTSAAYGSAVSFQLQAGSANGTMYTITITDATDASCSITTTVQQNMCSNCSNPNCKTATVIKN